MRAPFRRRLGVLVAAAGLVATLGAATGAHADDGPGSAVVLGADGIIYPLAPIIVGGSDGYLFVGQDFDYDCRDGRTFKQAMKRLGALAKVISRSGRTVVFTVAPNKSSVVLPDDPTELPHGICTQVGLARSNAAMDDLRDKNYLPIRSKLASTPGQTYWRTDTHWTTVGAAVYAKNLARRLSPRVGRAQKYVPTTRTKIGDLNVLVGRFDQPETAPAVLPANVGKVEPDPGQATYDPDQSVTDDYSWTSGAKKVVKGDTLLVGDSFTYEGLEPLQVLFEHGRFLWIGFSSLGKIVQGIKAADTVVIEVCQRLLANNPIASPAFVAVVQDALRS